jgi:hypothetical protein
MAYLALELGELELPREDLAGAVRSGDSRGAIRCAAVDAGLEVADVGVSVACRVKPRSAPNTPERISIIQCQGEDRERTDGDVAHC